VQQLKDMSDMNKSTKEAKLEVQMRLFTEQMSFMLGRKTSVSITTPKQPRRMPSWQSRRRKNSSDVLQTFQLY
jgi:hypothetical protein